MDAGLRSSVPTTRVTARRRCAGNRRHADRGRDPVSPTCSTSCRRRPDADHIAVVFDASGSSFRSRLYDQYKAHRPPPPEDLVPQFAHVRQAAEAFSIRQIELDGFEADDLIATYARHAPRAAPR